MSRGNDLRRISKKSLSTQTRAYAYIQQLTNVDDDRGGFTKSWVNTTVEPHAMAIMPLSAKQIFEYRSLNVEATHFIKIRGEVEVNELNQILYGSREFEILTVEDIQERGIVKWITSKERRA
jgi:SPP1 family predicted phage head-tail adaptor